MEDLARCVHCGLCSQSCPTYVETGLETESPRGRLHLMRAKAEGRITATPNFLKHIDLCLLCRNCEAVCPSGVPFGRIMQAQRAEVHATRPMPWWERLVRYVVFTLLMPHPARLAFMAGVLRFYQRSGLQRLVRGLSVPRLFPASLRQMEAMLPPLSHRFFPLTPGVTPARGERRGRAAVFSGCVMPYLYAEVNEATVRVLARNGYEVTLPTEQVCCGSLQEHTGERRAAEALARRNIDAFVLDDVDAIIVNAAGCGATLKEYHELLADDPDYREKARQFADRVFDVNEFLVKHELRGPLGAVPMCATYQDSCHLAHAQRVTAAPRSLLRAVPGVELSEMHIPDRCCGSAGIYNITQPEMSAQLLRDKMADVRSTGADTIVTANPGCMLQLSVGLAREGMEGRVAHVVQVLDWAYQAAEREDTRSTPE